MGANIRFMLKGANRFRAILFRSISLAEIVILNDENSFKQVQASGSSRAPENNGRMTNHEFRIWL